MIHIAFIGRLEREKGVLVLKTLIEATQSNTEIIWHIYGDGSFRAILEKLKSDQVHLYGHMSRSQIESDRKNIIDITLVPSEFLETFGLVAAESVHAGVGVIGFCKGGLRDWINKAGSLDEDHIRESFEKILQNIKKNGTKILLEGITEPRSSDLWKQEIQQMTAGMNTILLVENYTSIIGGAEIYVDQLKYTLESLGKKVILYGYKGNATPLVRKILGLIAPFAFWNGIILHTLIQKENPDLIWIHGIERYAGIFGLRAIYNAHKKTYITHHDLGLITARPSRVTHEDLIPRGLRLGTFIRGSSSIIELLARIGKYITIEIMWRYLREMDLHIVPSLFMQKPIEEFGAKNVTVFPHTID